MFLAFCAFSILKQNIRKSAPAHCKCIVAFEKIVNILVLFHLLFVCIFGVRCNVRDERGSINSNTIYIGLLWVFTNSCEKRMAAKRLYFLNVCKNIQFVCVNDTLQLPVSIAWENFSIMAECLCLFRFVRVPSDQFDIRFEPKNKEIPNQWESVSKILKQLKWQTPKQPQHFNDGCNNWQAKYKMEEKKQNWQIAEHFYISAELRSVVGAMHYFFIIIIIAVNAYMHYL